MSLAADWRGLLAAACLAGTLPGCGGPSTAVATAVPPTVDPARESELQVRYLRALIEKEPRHWRARVRLADLATTAGRDAEAFDLLRAASADAPRNVGLYAALAEAADAVEQLDWTLYGWQQVVRLAPDDAPSRVRLAQLCRRLDWQEDAARQLEVATAMAPDSLLVLREEASLYAVVGPPATARTWAERLVKKHPEAPYGYSLLADLAAYAARWREAVDYGSAAVERDPRNATFLSRLAQYQLTRTDAPAPDIALRTLDQAIAADPDSTAAHYWRGVVLRRLGRADEARRELETVYQKDPGYEAVALQLAELARTAGGARRADTLLAQYSKLETEGRSRHEAQVQLVARPLSAGAHLRMARIHLDSGEYGYALIEYLTAERLDPQSAPARQGVMEALRRQGRDAASLAPLKATGSRPANPAAS